MHLALMCIPEEWNLEIQVQDTDFNNEIKK